jgi:hypothetical protein
MFYGGYYGVSYEEARSLFFEFYGSMARNYLWQMIGISQYPSLLTAVNMIDVGVTMSLEVGLKMLEGVTCSWRYKV